MAIIRTLNEKTPVFGKNCFLAENATVIGDVKMGDYCSVWYGAVVRGDVHYIRIGNKVNIQDNATIHATYKTSPTNIGNLVSIAHNAVIHGCTIHDNVLIGIGAIILDDAVIEKNAIVAAGTLITKGTIVKEGTIFAGIPGRKIKDVNKDLIENEIHRIAHSYIDYANWYKEKK